MPRPKKAKNTFDEDFELEYADDDDLDVILLTESRNKPFHLSDDYQPEFLN